MTVFLPAGQVLTITAGASSTGSVARVGEPGAGADYGATVLFASTITSLGPFTENRKYSIVTGSGTALGYVIAPETNTVERPARTDVSASGAVPIADGVVVITKAGVAALTLAAPTAAQDRTIMRFVSQTANAHTLTATGLIQDGVTGGAKNLGTFAAFAGASLTLIALDLEWHVLAKNAVTIS